MFRRSKKAFSMFVAIAMLLSLIGEAVEAAVVTLTLGNPGGKVVDVTVKFDTQSNVLVDSAILYVDNAVYEKQMLSTPAKTGVVSFDWNTQNFAKGQHFIVVKLFANGKTVSQVSGYGVVSDNVFDVNPPKVSLANVTDNEVVSGTKLISINAKDDSGNAPIVSLLVDKKLKLMQNTQPYSYNLDTTTLADGKHTVEVYAFDLEGNQSDVVSYTIIVNNGNNVAEAAATESINLDTPKDNETLLASRPSVTVNENTEAGRISDSEISAGLGIKDTKPLILDGNEATVKEDTKIVVDDPFAVNTKTNKDFGVMGLKLADGTKNKTMDLNVPSVKKDGKSFDPVSVLLAKNTVSDKSFVENELKLASGVSLGELSLNTPNVAKSNASVSKTEDGVYLAKANAKSFTFPGELKIAEKIIQKSFDLNTPNVKVIKNAPAPVAAAETVKAEPAKAEVKDVAPAPFVKIPSSGKAKMRDLVNALNGTIFWDNRTKTVTAYVNNVKLEMKIGSKKAKVNGNPVTINLVPQLKGGRTIIDVTDFKNMLEAPALKD